MGCDSARSERSSPDNTWSIASLLASCPPPRRDSETSSATPVSYTHLDVYKRQLLAGVAEPEAKRKIIGAEFIRVFEEEARKVGDEVSFLAQGTIYPDILESDGVKAHHNVGGLPDDLQFELCEPVKLLYTDEVRVVGRELGLPESMVERPPFPGPGLGVRCLGAITRDRLEARREADAILREEFAAAGLEGRCV